MKILIAEDDTVSRKLIQHHVAEWGYDVVGVDDGAEALQLCQDDDFSIIITDWMMPRIDGLELVRLLRKSQSSKYIYIIMLTAKSQKKI